MEFLTLGDHRGLVPVLPSCLLEPLRDQFAALLPEHVDTHPLGCHNPRIPDRIVFERVIASLVHGSGYERIADRQCSDRTIRRRVKYWSQLGMAEQVHGLALQAYDRMIGLQLHELSVDGRITKAPCGGERAGRSPVDRDKQGLEECFVLGMLFGGSLGIRSIQECRGQGYSCVR